MVQYCKNSGSSAGVRDYLERFFVPFASANPQIQFAISSKPNKHPLLQGWYVKDRAKRLTLKNLSAEQVAERIQFLRDTRPIYMNKSAKAFRTTPSIQGEWELAQKLDQPHRTIRA